MITNYKLYLRSILGGHSFFFIENLAQRSDSSDVFLGSNSIYYLSTHLRLSSLFYLSQLSDIFSYEVLVNTNNNLTGDAKRLAQVPSRSFFSTIVYNFHILPTQHRFFIFTSPLSSFNSAPLGRCADLFSISDLFSSANWLEREASELHGLVFLGKKDLRNLMLQYGDASAPFQKSYPTVGLKEMFYSPIKDVLLQNPITLQI